MAALKLDMTIPLGSAGHVTFTADIADLDALTSPQRQVLADTAREFAEFGAATIAPAAAPDVRRLRDDMLEKPPAAIHDPSADVLRGVTGTRRNTS